MKSIFIHDKWVSVPTTLSEFPGSVPEFQPKLIPNIDLVHRALFPGD